VKTPQKKGILVTLNQVDPREKKTKANAKTVCGANETTRRGAASTRSLSLKGHLDGITDFAY